MKTLKTFEEFLAEGIVKKIKIDSERAKNLIKAAEKKRKYAK